MFSIQELRSSTKKELLQELAKVRQDTLKIRVSIKTKHEKDTSKAQKTKRYASRILTVLKEIQKEEVTKKPDTATEPATEKNK